jgi:tetratricopeptide (TPR) repeat protein
MRFRLVLAVSTGALVAALASAEAHADEQGDVEKARASYVVKKYDEAIARLRTLLDPTTKHPLKSPSHIADARMLLAAAHFGKGERDEAAKVIERLLLEKPEYEADPLLLPSPMINFFIDQRAALRDRLLAVKARQIQEEQEKVRRAEEVKRKERERIKRLEFLSTQERIVKRSSRWIAAVPFGVGQFQNGKTSLGWAFLATESALVVGTAITVPLYFWQLSERSAEYAIPGPDRDFRAQQWSDRAAATRIINLSLAGAFAVTAAVGIAEAQLHYVPERREVLKRKSTVGQWYVLPTGAGAAVGGTF